MESSDKIKNEIIKKMENTIGVNSLFDSIHYNDSEQIEDFINNMNEEQAIYCLVEATKAAYRRGSFKLEESEALSKALRIITK